MQTIPCNVLLEFNELVGDSVSFHYRGRTYNVDVQKNEEKTRLRGAGWHQLVERNHFAGGEMLVFSMGGAQPKILVAMFNEFFDEEEEEEAEEEGEQEPPYIIAQRSNLTEGELHGLDVILPLPDAYIGMPFVTCLTTTNLTKNQMVCVPTFSSKSLLCKLL